MARESFEDPAAAEILNRDFIAVKVDKEERPDIDSIYMSVCQALTGGGGWPLSVFLTPEREPFYVGTYFPKEARYGQPAFTDLLRSVRETWDSDRGSLLDAGASISDRVSRLIKDRGPSAAEPDRAPILSAVRGLGRSFDARWGGFGPAPKFPTPSVLLLLLRVYRLEGDENALSMAERTLRGICHGGIHDHVGGGFSRYSTDEMWLAPHFEKMLYDNAQLVLALLECFELTGKDAYKDAAEGALRYVAREMTGPEGGFYSAQDADSDGEEGKFYTFTPDEVTALLGPLDGARLCHAYDITRKGNFEGKSIPNRIGQEHLIPPEMAANLDRLRAYRADRYHLHKDDKVLTAWNALMIAAYARAYRVLEKEAYRKAAEDALTFVRRHLTAEGALRISYRDGKTSGDGLLDDYAFLVWACLEMYAATFEPAHLQWAITLSEQALERFPDPAGGFYMTEAGRGDLIFRPKDVYDGAMPSGNSVLAHGLLRLAAITGEPRWRQAAERQLAFLMPFAAGQPAAYTFALTAISEAVYPSGELICVLNSDRGIPALRRALRAHGHPNLSVVVKTPENAAALEALLPSVKAYKAAAGEPYTFYLCQNQTCAAPFYKLEELEARLLPMLGSGKVPAL